jgi:hypothetical protein
MAAGALPLLVKVMLWLALVVPVAWDAKVRLVALGVTSAVAFSMAMTWPPRRIYSFERVWAWRRGVFRVSKPNQKEREREREREREALKAGEGSSALG